MFLCLSKSELFEIITFVRGKKNDMPALFANPTAMS